MRRVLLAVAMCGVVTGANAADLADLPILRGAFTEGLTTSRANWQGAYIGGQAGKGTADIDFTNATQEIAEELLFLTAIETAGGVSQWPVGGEISVHGQGFGGFFGYNHQWDDVVLGVELSYLHGKFGGSQTSSMSRFFTDGSGYTDGVTYESIGTMKISDMGTLRARAGYVWNAFLPYAFGAIALGRADIIRTAHIFGTQVNLSAPPGFQNVPFDLTSTKAQNAHFIYGYSAGLGVDMQLVSSLFLRAEWEYVRFTAPIDTTVNTVRAGVGYRF